jgi:hypothetical protein
MPTIKNQNFKDINLTYGKTNKGEWVFFENCVFNNVRINTYSGKLRFISCKFEKNCKIQEVNLPGKDTSNHYIDLVDISTRTFGKNMEVIGTNINITKPADELKGLILSGDNIILNLNSKVIDDIKLLYRNQLCVNDAVLINAELTNNSLDGKKSAEENFSNCFINNDDYSFKLNHIYEKKPY